MRFIEVEINPEHSLSISEENSSLFSIQLEPIF